MKKHLPILILILILGLYLGVKALDENSWDGWRVGSAQILLSVKHWANDGFFQSYFLFLPQGYSKVIRYFDDPELRQHTRGVATGGFIGKRLYYTHYPSGYILPISLLMKLGAENRFWFRLLQILFSLAGLIFLYWAFILISKDRLVAFLGILFYGVSTIFLDYADSLAAMPLEELMRAAIIVLSIVALKNQKKYFNYLIWTLYFILAFSSYDSTFFIFAWLVGLDLVINKKFNWKKWLFFASAPILAFILQLIQNTVYLGWHNMLLDLYGAFKVQMVGSRSGFFASHLKRLIEPFGWFFGVTWYLGIIVSILGIWCLKIIKKYSNVEILDIRYLYLSFAAILFHFLFFPSLFFYQGRIVAIFGGLLVGILTVNLFKIIGRIRIISINSPARLATRSVAGRYISIGLIIVLVSGLWFIQGKRTHAYLKQWPNNVWPQTSIEFDKKIKNLVSGDKVVFQILGPDREIAGSDRYPMAASEDEYYTDTPILGFTNTTDLIRDFNYLKNRSEFPFNSIIVTDKEEVAEIIKRKLKTKESISKIDNRFILIIP